MSGNAENERNTVDDVVRRTRRQTLREVQNEINRELDKLRNQIRDRKKRLFIMKTTLNPIHAEDRQEEVTRLRETYEVDFELERELILREIESIKYKMKPLREASMKIQFDIEELIENETFYEDWF